MKQVFYFLFIFWTLMSGASSWAGDPAPFPDFTFKRIQVPGAGGGKRITVQIDPNAPVAPPEVPDQVKPPEQADPFAWYWEEVSPSLKDSSPGRLEAAVSHLNLNGTGAGVSAPRLQDMQDIANQFGSDILLATIGTSVSPALVLAVMFVESRGKVDAVSSAGAQGLMQLIPATAERFGVTDASNAADNIKGGVAYLNWLMEKFDSDPVLVLAAYNAGENAIIKNDGVPAYPETRAYVPKILAAWTVARGLCITPPQFISDGCVFAVQAADKQETNKDD